VTEYQLSQLEAALATPRQDFDQIVARMSLAVRLAPALIAEVRRLRSLHPEPERSACVEPVEMTIQATQAVLRDVGKMIQESCVEGTGFLLTLFDTSGGYEPIYAFNAGRGDTLKALHRVAQLVEQSR